ncbi:hypothetical protein [Eleftheria terrae]|nr:hypothetical protein [Eleftheria terrae]WKB50705.1 hypothetical protein N7L95_12805 [Eleftheria terrae]
MRQLPRWRRRLSSLGACKAAIGMDPAPLRPVQPTLNAKQVPDGQIPG